MDTYVASDAVIVAIEMKYICYIVIVSVLSICVLSLVLVNSLLGICSGCIHLCYYFFYHTLLRLGDINAPVISITGRNIQKQH